VRVELGSEPAWVRQARALPSRRNRGLEAEPANDDPAFEVQSYGAGRFFALNYQDGTRFMIDSQGRRVWGDWTQPWTKEDFATYLLGPALGFVLRRKGITPFHASVFCVDGHAFVICGDAHAGKSTTAAALALRGIPILCEDIAALWHGHSSFAIES